MSYLALSVFCAVGNFLLFRFLSDWKANSSIAIATNYLICILLGWFLRTEQAAFNWQMPWLPWAILIGVMYASMYWLIGMSSRHLGVNPTTVASKMSFVIPMTAAIFLYQAKFGWQEILGSLLAIASIVLNGFKARNSEQPGWLWLLPVTIFLGGGMADLALNYVEHHHLTNAEQPLFLMAVFISAAFISWAGVGIEHVKKRVMTASLKNSFLAGTLLGVLNFTSVYALLKALKSAIPIASIFPLLNIGIIVMAAVGSWFFFKETPKGMQRLSLPLAILAIILFSKCS